MSRMHSRQFAKITIESEGRMYKFDVDDWALDLEQPRVDVSHIGSPNLAWMQGPTRGRLEFRLASQPREPETVEAGLEVLHRYLRLIGAVDE